MILNQSFSFFPLQSVYRRVIRRSPVINPHIIFSGATNYYFVPVFCLIPVDSRFGLPFLQSAAAARQQPAEREGDRAERAVPGPTHRLLLLEDSKREKKTEESRYRFW
jgi:hypothetical protein